MRRPVLVRTGGCKSLNPPDNVNFCAPQNFYIMIAVLIITLARFLKSLFWEGVQISAPPLYSVCLPSGTLHTRNSTTLDSIISYRYRPYHM